MGLKIVFVYNADSGIFSKVSDFAHKVISPSTYQCNLCSLTYSNLGIKKEWAEFIKNLNIATEFLHKDEFIKKYGRLVTDFPAIFIQNKHSPRILIPYNVINECASIKELEGKIISAFNTKLRKRITNGN